MQVSDGEHFASGRSVASTAYPARCLQEPEPGPERLVEVDDAWRRLIRENNRSRVAGQPCSSSYLVVPRERVSSVVGELHVVGRVSVDEVVRLEQDALEVAHRELPSGEYVRIFGEIPSVFDALVTTERNIESTSAIESAKAVVTGSIEIVEEPRRRSAVPVPVSKKHIETVSTGVEVAFRVQHRTRDHEAGFQPAVEIDQVRIDVVEQRSFWDQSYRDGKPTAERFHQSSMAVRCPQSSYMWHLPTLSTGPFEGRSKSTPSSGCSSSLCVRALDDFNALQHDQRGKSSMGAPVILFPSPFPSLEHAACPPSRLRRIRRGYTGARLDINLNGGAA